jgi:phage shock protein PspC (stress-responsive transcriptional regulator)
MDTTATQYPPADNSAGAAHDARTSHDAGTGHDAGASYNAGTGHEADAGHAPGTGRNTGAPAPRPPLYRPFDDRMLAGVASGVARYLGIDVTVVRIILAVLAVVGGAGVPLYLAGWLLIPDEDSDQSLASAFISSIQGRSR